MLRSILVICVGNICRSPVGERLLAARLPDMDVSSAGIGALMGRPADETMAAVAEANGLALDGHRARQFTPQMGAAAHLILVMEPGHKQEILRRAPELSGRVMLFDHWTGARGIKDPFRKDRAVHEQVFSEISAAADTWIARLAPKE